MKIIVLTNNYPRKNALNSGIFINHQVKALQLLGVECYVLLLHNWYPPFGLHSLHSYWREGWQLRETFFEEYEGVKIFSVPMFIRMPSRIFKERYYDRAARAVIKFVRRNAVLQGADWIYAHFLTDAGYIGAKVKDELKVKLAAIARGDDVHAWPEENPALRHNLEFVFEKADLLLANSGQLGEDMKKWMQPGKTRTTEIVYNGIDVNQFRPAATEAERMVIREKHKLPAGKKYMICVATPVAIKGWMELLEAIKLMDDGFDGWILLLVGPERDHKDAIDLTKAGKDMGIENKLFYIGQLNPDNLSELFRACDVFALPSYNEGMSNALLEAMASGLACVTTDVGGHSEVIENNADGILIKPRSVEELTTAIRTVTGNEELRKAMGKKAREKMIVLGDYLYNSRKLLELFKSRLGH